MRKLTIVAGTAAMLALAGCNAHNPGQRAVGGGAIGALGGAGVAAATDGDPLTGALIGGGLGAVLGAVTADDDRGHRRYHRGRDYDHRYYDRRRGYRR